MEIPAELKNLYRHWKFHIESAEQTRGQKIPTSSVVTDEALAANIADFIHERISIWRKKTAGEKPPFTKDAVLSTYRFCNIFREFDRQTIEFHKLLNPVREDFPLWLLNMFYCRMVARPETVREVGLLSFDKRENEAFYQRLTKSSRPRYGTPYVFPVSTIMKSDTPTRELFIAQYLPKVMKEAAKEISGSDSSWKKVSVYEGVKKILPKFGFNLSFLWTEVLIDVAYQYPEYIDLFGRFPIGPGSMPTLKRIDARTDSSEVVKNLATTFFNTGIAFNGKLLRLSAENWEGIGCEFRKYTNLSAGKGRKRKYK